MEPFTLQVGPVTKVTGLLSLPISTLPKSKHKPLLVCIHGGTYSSRYFDTTPTQSVEAITSGLEIPVIAIDRPGYQGSTAPTLCGDQTSIQENGILLHTIVLPALWREYGKPAGATTMILLGHSVGGYTSIVIGGLHGNDSSPSYPLGGLIISGVGIGFIVDNPTEELLAIFAGASSEGQWPSHLRDEIMMRLSLGISDPNLAGATQNMNFAMPPDEIIDISSKVGGYWKIYAADVKVPVAYGLAEFDALYDTKPRNIAEFGAAFTKCKNFSGFYVSNAPHCIELSYQARAWYTKVCGFATECAVAQGQ